MLFMPVVSTICMLSIVVVSITVCYLYLWYLQFLFSLYLRYLSFVCSINLCIYHLMLSLPELSIIFMLHVCGIYTIGITHVFLCINICRVPRKLFEYKADRPSVETSSEGPGKCKCNETNMCDRYSCIFYLIPT